MPPRRQPSCPALSHCIYELVQSPPLNIAYSQAIIIHLTVRSVSSLSLFTPSVRLFSCSTPFSQINLFSFLQPPRTPPPLLLPLSTFISFPLRFLLHSIPSSQPLSCSPAVSLPPTFLSLRPGTVYNFAFPLLLLFPTPPFSLSLSHPF